MSLVILSNQLEVKEENTPSEWEKPYAFHNALKDTLRIPPNSEVALQSIKVNKNTDTITLDGSQLFYQTYGNDLVDPAVSPALTQLDTTQIPIMCRIRPVNNFAENVSHQLFADRVGVAMNEGIPHPDFFGEQACTVKLDSSNDYDGFNLSYQGRGDMGGTSYIPGVDKWVKRYDNASGDDDDTLTMSVSGSNIRATSKNGDRAGQSLEALMIAQDVPISHFNGEVRWDLDGLFTYGGANGHEIEVDCAMGLSRTNQGGINQGDPSYFNDAGSELPTADGYGNLQFFDYVIRIEKGITDSGYRLWVGQSALSPNAEGPEQDIEYVMREVEYFGWATTGGKKPEAPFQSERYNMGTNTAKINQFKIQIEGERVNFWYHTGTKDTLTTGAGDANNGGSYGTWLLLCSTKSTTATEWATLNDNSNPVNQKNYRQHVPKPISTATYNMYPLMYINATADNGGGGKYYFDCSKYGGRNITDGVKINSASSDYVQRLRNSGNEETLEQLESRYMFIMGGGEVPPKNNFYTEDFTHSKNKLATFSYNAMLGTPTVYDPTVGANAREVLGFKTDLLTATSKPPTLSGVVYTYGSDVKPQLDSQTNLFVRLNNFSQRSFNAGIGRPSKIIYTLPRFDMSGRDIGSGLYYEPGERLYLNLANTEELYMNEFDISIVDSRERLARVLNGTTVICLHFRPSSTTLSRT